MLIAKRKRQKRSGYCGSNIKALTASSKKPAFFLFGGKVATTKGEGKRKGVPGEKNAPHVAFSPLCGETINLN